MGGKEVGGGGKWRGERELRGEGEGAMQKGREHAKKGERWENLHIHVLNFHSPP